MFNPVVGRGDWEIAVTVGEETFQVNRGTKIHAFIKRHLPHLADVTLGAVVANRLVELDWPLAAPCELSPVSYNSKEGARIFRASLTIVLCEAALRLFPGASVQVGQSLGDGYYFDLKKADGPLVEGDVEALREEMSAMVERDEVIASRRVPSHEAVHILHGAGQESKVELIRALRQPWTTLVSMGKYVDVWLHPLVPSARLLKPFSLEPYEEGMVLAFPSPADPNVAPRAANGSHSVLFPVYRETRRWNRLLGVETVADLNRAVMKGSISEVVRVAEALHERKFASVADQIVSRSGCRLVLVAGPSSSGKTTTIKRLRMQLLAVGVRPKEISLDNYYVDRVMTPLGPDGEPDFECIEAIDLELLNEHLELLLSGREAMVPRYSFVRGKRDEEHVPLHLEDDEILLIEGIHGLNDQLTQSIPESSKVKVFASALTQLCIDDHNRIFTSDSRLLRRIVRDRLFRGYSAEDSLNLWPRVRRGEEQYLFPFQSRADIVFNSALVYEQAVLKVFAERFLMEIPQSSPTFLEASRLIEFLDLFVPIFPEDVPATSILREFIGGSAFRY